jgi:hypothetical protein
VKEEIEALEESRRAEGLCQCNGLILDDHHIPRVGTWLIFLSFLRFFLLFNVGITLLSDENLLLFCILLLRVNEGKG